MKARAAMLAALALLSPACSRGAADDGAAKRTALTITGASGAHVFRVEIARTGRSRRAA